MFMYQHEVAHEGETGKVSKANFHDRNGRTVLIMRPGKQVCLVSYKLMECVPSSSHHLMYVLIIIHNAEHEIV